MKLFQTTVLNLLLKLSKYKPEITHSPDESYPGYDIVFHKKGLRKYKFFIWGIGEWMNYYDLENKNELSFFGFHNHHIDKIRPSYSNLVVEGTRENLDMLVNEIEYLLNSIINNPISSYHYSLEGRIIDKNGLLEYISANYFHFYYNKKEYLKDCIMPNLIFYILYFCSLFDRHIDSKKIYIDRDKNKFISGHIFYDYTFGFPITSDDEDVIYSKWMFYSEYPRKILKVNRFNVFPIKGIKNEKEIKRGLMLGIYYNEKD